MARTRAAILEHFDEDVARLLAGTQKDTLIELDRMSRFLRNFLLMQDIEKFEAINATTLRKINICGGDASPSPSILPVLNERAPARGAPTTDSGNAKNMAKFTATPSAGTPRNAPNTNDHIYNLNWKLAEQNHQIFLRKDLPIVQDLLQQVSRKNLPLATLRFQNAASIHFFRDHPNLKGTISLDKLKSAALDCEEHLVLTALTQDGTALDDALVERLMELDATILPERIWNPPELDTRRTQNIAQKNAEIDARNKEYFLEECEKLDANSAALKNGLESELRELDTEIQDKTAALKKNLHLPLAQIVEHQKEIATLKEKRTKMRADLFRREDEIDKQNDDLQKSIRKRLKASTQVEHIWTISFEV
jgi:adenine-specific DNA-methyltransferase